MYRLSLIQNCRPFQSCPHARKHAAALRPNFSRPENVTLEVVKQKILIPCRRDQIRICAALSPNFSSNMPKIGKIAERRFRAVIVGIPLASVAAYHLSNLEEICR